MITENEIKQIVIERLKVLPANTGISIGSKGTFNKEDLIEHIEGGDEIGKQMIEVELNFLRGLKEGILYEA